MHDYIRNLLARQQIRGKLDVLNRCRARQDNRNDMVHRSKGEKFRYRSKLREI
jgi:hypothetical protein